MKNFTTNMMLLSTYHVHRIKIISIFKVPGYRDQICNTSYSG